MHRLTLLFIILISVCALAHADDGRGLKRSGEANAVSISGVSSGAAMAVQYAVAHSASIVGVGSVAGPAWGCAEGSVSKAINDCMCGRDQTHSEIDLAYKLASNQEHALDPLMASKPAALRQAYVFQSPADAVVVPRASQASIDFLTSFIGKPPVVDRGSATDGSNRAGHGIISPDGSDSCSATGNDPTYVRQCGKEDNAGKLLHAIYGKGKPFDPGKRAASVPESEIWRFDQQHIVNEVKKTAGTIAPDSFFGIFPVKSERRKNLDLARTGYLYVPPSCRADNSHCNVHIALHGCKQDARNFAATAGYNNWAEYYKLIVVYPAVQQQQPTAGEVCQVGTIPSYADDILIEQNDNGCWDWWGYLDIGWPQEHRYLSKQAPQMQVIERIIGEVTRPISHIPN